MLDHPRAVLAAAAAAVALLGAGVPRFELDASPEALLLEDDRALAYFRSVKARYGADGGPLIVTYTPRGELFAPDALAGIERLRQELAALPAVESVTSLLDVPLLESPPVTLAELQSGYRTLRAEGVDLELARRELTTSPLYGNLVVGEAGRTTALYLNLAEDPEQARLAEARDALLAAKLERALTPQEAARLEELSRAARDRAVQNAGRLREAIEAVRALVARYRDGAEIQLAGGPLIISDMIRFVRHDLVVFGAAAFAFMVVLLAAAFRRVRWVMLPAAVCAAAGLAMTGFLGWAGWRVTVVSSNFLAVLLVVTLSLVVHLVVRFRELHAQRPGAVQRELVAGTLTSKLAPSAFTALTTMVAFASLALSGIRPVIDFGWMMVLGIAFAFVLAFTLFPAALMLGAPPAPPPPRPDPLGVLLGWTATATRRGAAAILVAGAALLVLGVAGAARLSVENRFIDYFDESTEIYQGIVTLDRELGGTTPLDVILEGRAPSGAEPPAAAGFTARSYWFNTARLDTIAGAHAYLERLPESGKVLSAATAVEVLERLNRGPLDDFLLSIVYTRLPDALKDIVLDPYLSPDGDQARLAVRFYESDPGMKRDALLEKIRRDLAARADLAPEQVRLSGLMVLYNNVLQTLFRSQALTAGFVLAAVAFMFAALFRSLTVAAIALVPNLLVAALVLGTMGWAGVPLDIMTITIAAIVLGIAVDDTIHYTHRYLEERRRHAPWDAVRRAHSGVGRAMACTTLVLAFGFALFTASAFVPIVTFGLLTGLAVIAALAADLTVLPALLAGRRRA
ncbi:MAG TPA: MMPL family transporter [Burkholderiales bacterium]